MKYRFNFATSKLNYYFQKKSSFVIFLLILMGVVLPTVSGSPGYGFFDKLYFILTNQFFNMFFFFAAGLSVIYMKNEFSRSYNIVCRSDDYKNLVKSFIKDIVFETVFLYVIAIILSMAGAAIFCFGEYGFANHQIYEFNLLYYLLFFCFRSFAIASLINVIIYLISNVFKNKITMLLILILNMLFTILNSSKIVSHFYNMSIFYHHYFLKIEYSYFLLEILCSVLEILLLLVIVSFIYKIITSKKRDLI